MKVKYTVLLKKRRYISRFDSKASEKCAVDENINYHLCGADDSLLLIGLALNQDCGNAVLHLITSIQTDFPKVYSAVHT